MHVADAPRRCGARVRRAARRVGVARVLHAAHRSAVRGAIEIEALEQLRAAHYTEADGVAGGVGVL